MWYRKFTKVFPGILTGMVFVSMLWTTSSCEEFCEDDNHTALVVNFYRAETEVPEDMKNVYIAGVDNDTWLYEKATLKTALCPLNPGSDVMEYAIVLPKNDTVDIIDLITITYTRSNGFISSECGCVTYGDISEIIHTTDSIKRIELINPRIGTVSYRQNVANAENIRIYY